MSGNFLLDKLLINQRQQLVGCQGIGLLDLSEDPCDFAHGGQNTGANAMSPSPNGKAVELGSVKPGLSRKPLAAHRGPILRDSSGGPDSEITHEFLTRTACVKKRMAV